MKSLSIFITLFIFAMSTANAATLNVKMKKNTQWGEESAQLATDKGLISIYALELTKKQANDLNTLKKGNCVQIKAKDQTLEKSDGVISVMEFESAKTVKCK
ncbi:MULTISPECIES: hypothetical protein [Acinetobacter]|uniref:Uncharacterized protein n=1 Tax=Acinetobacter corruptisaponis TaxID=3045147 RepID=A0ABY8S743_9GAMM|nr:hypothetical protein [Acinetobacter sp. KCTC 92772]WHP07515.1 hypothetical protein QLH32_08730 [Acinetobacter sp. KCTC 92772]